MQDRRDLQRAEAAATRLIVVEHDMALRAGDRRHHLRHASGQGAGRGHARRDRERTRPLRTPISASGGISHA